MARIAYITIGYTSYLNAGLGLCHRLVAAGHQVTFLSPVDLREKMEGEGFPFVHLTADEPFLEAAQRDPAPKPWHVLRFLRWIERSRQRRLDSIQRDEIERTLKEHGFDLIVADLEMHVAILSSFRLGIPIFLGTVLYSMFYDPQVPPLDSTIIPDAEPSTRRAIETAWKDTRREARRIRLKRRLSKRGLLDYLRPVPYKTFSLMDLRAVSSHHDFPIESETDDQHWLRPFIYTRLPILCFCPWEMEFPHPRREHVHYVGPMVQTDRIEPPLSPSARESLNAFVARRSEEHAAIRPLVYCSLGTFWSADTVFLGRVCEAFRDRPDWDLVIGLGGTASVTELEPLPPNVLVLDWAPQLEILGMADAVITHGGSSTISECLVFGLPMLVYSTGFVDQNGNAARVAYHGAGILGSKDNDDPPAIQEKVRRVLTDSDLRRRVHELQAACLKYQEEGTAERLIDRALARGES
jgi:UDP:flavonoid glycosyltransferase YjiC (YdhE family)